jgi:hypothetical protein
MSVFFGQSVKVIYDQKGTGEHKCSRWRGNIPKGIIIGTQSHTVMMDLTYEHGCDTPQPIRQRLMNLGQCKNGAEEWFIWSSKKYEFKRYGGPASDGFDGNFMSGNGKSDGLFGCATITAEYDGPNKKYTIYCNHWRSNQKTLGTAFNIKTTEIRAGVKCPSWGEDFDGCIMRLRVFDGVLGPDQVKLHSGGNFCRKGSYCLSTKYAENNKCGSLQDYSGCGGCPLGTYGPVAKLFKCTSCPKGKTTRIRSSTSLDDCVTPCNKGYVPTSVAGPQCAPCPRGETSNGLVCRNCDPGKFTPGPGSSECTDCEAGKYSSQAGSKKCENCPEAKSTNGQTGASSCSQCPMGKVADNPGNSNCYACPKGKYSTTYPHNTDMNDCKTCPSGKTSYTDGSIGCVSDCSSSGCLAGQYLLSTTCTACPAGRYNPSPGATTRRCTECPAGKYTSNTGSTSASVCSPCPIGKYSDGPNDNICTPCPAGTFGATTGLTKLASCTACPAGRYRSSPGAGSVSDCDQCTAGKASSVTARTTVCPDCEAGKYSDTVGKAECTNCPAGKYSGQGSISCTACPAGRYRSSPGAGSVSDCDQCTAGKASHVTGAASATTCVSCAAGEYSDGATSRCELCPPGKASSTVASTSASACTTCPAGRFGDGYGNTVCTPCSVGKYEATGGATDISKCLTCDTASSEGATFCNSCPAGTLAGIDKICRPCAAGKYLVSDSCVVCPMGRYASVEGGTSIDKLHCVQSREG